HVAPGPGDLAFASPASTDWTKAHTAVGAGAGQRASMSATSHDTLPRQPGQQPTFGEVTVDAAENTEDIADEITSELAESGAAAAAAPVRDAMAAVAESEICEQHPAPGAGSVLRDRYVLESLLGGGGTSLVYRALDLRRDATGSGGQ